MAKFRLPPAAANFALVVRGAVTHSGARAERRVTEPILREFLVLLEEIQQELDARWNCAEGSGPAADHAQRANARES
jgi:hypothetical protein